MDYRVIKEEDLFCLTDLNGDISEHDENGHGLYTKDTRFLSRMELLIDGEKPALLSSQADRSYYASFRLMKVSNDEGAVEVLRERFIQGGSLYEQVSITNYYPQRRTFEVTVVFEADFQDMFLVRKYRTGEVGQIVGRDTSDRMLSIRYQGKDELARETQVRWDAKGAKAEEDGHISFTLNLDMQETRRICFTVTPILPGLSIPVVDTFEEGLKRLEASYGAWNENATQVMSDSPAFNGLYARGVQDLRMLMTDFGYGELPVAGLPWFAVPFGRDSLITSLFMLPLNPLHVQGTLRTLAAYQGTEMNAERDEQPGKIMHEIRFGELVTTGQSPFAPYYGSADSTPLFLVLLVEYVRWTGDLALAQELVPNIERALAWMDTACEDQGGFLTYHQEAEKGFPNQGWKDSANSIVHSNGSYAASPIALSEVQGYVYQAKTGLAPIVARIGLADMAERLAQEAAELKLAFEAAFWLEDERFYAVALDKDRQPVHSVTSNPGHLLMGGLADQARADEVVQRLLASDMNSGFGIRTMSTEATGYYPMSYHNGSVWPHDNGMILLGLTRLGYKQEIGVVLAGLLSASTHFEYQRLPELFCGYSDELGYPVPYPTTCSPQAWAAATSVVFVQAILGLVPDALTKVIVLNPVLPEGINSFKADHIRIGDGHLSVMLNRNADSASPLLDILENSTGFELKVGLESTGQPSRAG
jgi:glycogen debranching enzyme